MEENPYIKIIINYLETASSEEIQQVYDAIKNRIPPSFPPIDEFGTDIENDPQLKEMQRNPLWEWDIKGFRKGLLLVDGNSYKYNLVNSNPAADIQKALVVARKEYTGQTLQAIKYLRQQLEIDLKEARDLWYEELKTKKVYNSLSAEEKLLIEEKIKNGS